MTKSTSIFIRSTMAPKSLKKSTAVGILFALFTGAAAAAAPDTSDAFYEFYSTVTGWTSGGLGVGLATSMLLMGGAIGVAQNSPMPALTGVAGAAFLHWGPSIIQTIMGATT
jgi:conjugal transfer pilus assembly protein TraA